MLTHVLLYLSVTFITTSAHAFVEPTQFDCDSKVSIYISAKNKKKILSKGLHRIPLKDASVVEIRNAEGTIAKIFPRDDIDFVLIQKKSFAIQSDGRSYLNVLNAHSEKILKCLLNYE